MSELMSKMSELLKKNNCTLGQRIDCGYINYNLNPQMKQKKSIYKKRNKKMCKEE